MDLEHLNTRTVLNGVDDREAYGVLMTCLACICPWNPGTIAKALGRSVAAELKNQLNKFFGKLVCVKHTFFPIRDAPDGPW